MYNSQYLVWWALADKWPEHQRMCESMARLVCRASRLKGDDPRNKDAGHSSSVCSRCVLGITENAMHVIMQCPAGEKVRGEMLKEIEGTSEAFRVKSNEDPGNVFHWRIGKDMEDVDEDEMDRIRIIAGYNIVRMYWGAISEKEWVG